VSRIKIKRLVKRTVALFSTLLLTVLPAAGCGQKAPAVEELYGRVVELVEGSHEVNTLLFGAGIPVHEKEDEGSALKHLYGTQEFLSYEYAREQSDYYFPEDVKRAAERIYSEGYLKSVYTSLFDGIMIPETGAVLYARYMETPALNGGLSQSVNAEGMELTPRIYRYETMRVEPASTSKYALVTMETYLPSESGTPEIVEVTLSLTYENGNWFLDSPSY
jgi:hypothetical protein